MNMQHTISMLVQYKPSLRHKKIGKFGSWKGKITFHIARLHWIFQYILKVTRFFLINKFNKRNTNVFLEFIRETG